MAKPQTARIKELEDDLKIRDRRIEDLRREIDEMRDLNKRLGENADDYVNTMEAWQSLDMTTNENGDWTWQPFWKEHNDLVDRYSNLVQKWNRNVRVFNDTIAKQPVGRPLAASEAQVITVQKLHKKGLSLRGIMDETSLGFATVRTIVGQINSTDRTTQKRRERLGLERIVIDKMERARQKRQRRTGNTLPARAQAVAEQGRALAQEVRGLGKR
jgi:hypothetical protein